MPNRSTVARLLLPLLVLAACGDASSPEPSAPATIIGSVESNDEPPEDAAPAAGVVESDEKTLDIDDDNPSSSSDSAVDSSSQNGDGPADDATRIDDEPNDSSDDNPDDNSDDASAGNAGGTTGEEAGTSGADLAANLPPPDAIEGATASGYTSIEELTADRAERPPLLRCGATQDPTSLAIASQADAAGRSFDYDDGLRTTTVQLWDYPDVATAERAMALIDALVCDVQAVGPISIDDIEYDQFDSASVAPPAFDFEGVDQAVGASFERALTSTTDLVVQEELQFARVGTVVLFAGAREIRVPDVDAELPIDDAQRVGQDTVAALLGGASTGFIRSPATLRIDGPEARTYRSLTTGFCLVRIDSEDGATTQVSWGAEEQAVWTATVGQEVDFGDGCGTWEPIEPAATASRVAAGASGTLLVGTDIPAGPLVVTSVGDCSIDLLAGFSGSASDLISSTILAPGESVEVNLASTGIYLASDCRY